MIHYTNGNILDSEAQALVNTVNTVGVMGKGIALQFRNQFPCNYHIYRRACQNGEIAIGRLLVTEEESLLTGRKLIINFPTKTHWRLPSRYDYIRRGLIDLTRIIEERDIQSIAVPPLGAGNGGLNRHRVKEMTEEALRCSECDVYIFEPDAAPEASLIRDAF